MNNLINKNFGPVYLYKNFSTSKELVKQFKIFLKNSFDIDKIEYLHTLNKQNNELTFGTDQSTFIHKEIYKDFDKGENSKIISEYRKLILETMEEISDLFNMDEWFVQRFPSLRIQFPENISVFEFHRDSTYNHPLGEINHFLAITNCLDSAALHIEQNLGWGNYKPLNLIANQSALINTSIFKHGDIENKTGLTRISIDFRFIPKKVLLQEEAKESITAKRKFTSDDYFMSIDEFN